MNDTVNPYAPPQTVAGDLSPADNVRPAIRGINTWCVAYALFVLVSFVALLVQTRTVIFTGIIGSIAAIILFMAVGRSRPSNLIPYVFTMCGPLVVAAMTFIISTMAWSPQQARGPLIVVVACYFLVSIALLFPTQRALKPDRGRADQNNV